MVSACMELSIDVWSQCRWQVLGFCLVLKAASPHLWCCEDLFSGAWILAELDTAHFEARAIYDDSQLMVCEQADLCRQLVSKYKICWFEKLHGGPSVYTFCGPPTVFRAVSLFARQRLVLSSFFENVYTEMRTFDIQEAASLHSFADVFWLISHTFVWSSIIWWELHCYQPRMTRGMNSVCRECARTHSFFRKQLRRLHSLKIIFVQFFTNLRNTKVPTTIWEARPSARLSLMCFLLHWLGMW